MGAAESTGERITNTLIDSSAFCNKLITAFTDGAKHGSLTTNNRVRTYFGPNTLCSRAEIITKKNTFVVTGSVKSTFGRQWYQIEVSGRERWVAAKYVALGDVVRPDIDEKEIPEVLVTASLDLNARDCPDTGCALVGSLTKDSSYSATKQAANGWYYVRLSGGKQGWVSGKYVAVESSPKPEEPIQKAEESTPREQATQRQEVVVSHRATETTDAKPIAQEHVVLPASQKKQKLTDKTLVPEDPCIATSKIRYSAKKEILHLTQPQTFQLIPHTQCDLTFDLAKGKAFILLGETEYYYVVAAVPSFTMKQGYLRKELYQGQFSFMESMDHNTDIFTGEMAEELLAKEEYWNSYEFKAYVAWLKLQSLYYRHKGKFFCLFAFLLGLLMLPLRALRQKMLRLNQLFIRTLYFSIRSRQFWYMLRKLVFILMLCTAVLFALFSYVMWLKEIANLRQMIMGYGSLGLMSMSVGMFGVRVASFFTGLLLFFLSLFEFLLFVALLCFLFLLPGLLLLLVYYVTYRRGQQGGTQPPTVFNHEEIERIHERVFRLRNFYPETVITWARDGGVKKRWDAFKGVVRAKSDIFDAFFSSVDARSASGATA